MISPTTPVRRAVGGLLGVVGGHGVKAFSVVGGKSSLVGRLTARPLRQRGTQDRLALVNRNRLSERLAGKRPLKSPGSDVVLDPSQLHQLLLLLVRQLLANVVHTGRPAVTKPVPSGSLFIGQWFLPKKELPSLPPGLALAGLAASSSSSW